MKAFEKWWKPSNEVMCYECGGYCKEDAEAVWRAALEWILRDEDAYCCGEVDGWDEWHECPKDTAILKELKDS